MACLFGKSTNFLPSPIVASNVCGSKPRPLLAVTREIVAPRSVWNVALIGTWRTVLFLRGGPWGRRAGDIDTSLCLDTHLLTSARRPRLHFTTFMDSVSIRRSQPPIHSMVPNRENSNSGEIVPDELTV